MKKTKTLFPAITKKECLEFAQAAILFSLLFALKLGTRGFLELALGCTLISILAPILFFPFAFLWFSIAKILSVVMPAVILSLIFFLVLSPTGLLRRLMGRDRLTLRVFKKDTGSVLTIRNRLFTTEDQEHTF